MKGRFWGSWGVQKGNPVEAFVGGKKFVGTVKKRIEVDGRLTEIVVEIEGGAVVTAERDKVRRMTKGAGQKRWERRLV